MVARLKLSHPVVHEHALQKEVADVLRRDIAVEGRVSAEGVVWFAIDVAMFFGSIPGAGRGIIDGLPDLWFLWDGKAFLIELKRRDGTLSESQKAFVAAGLCAAIHVGVASDVSHVLHLLDSWGVPRKKRTRIAA